jgi:uncharacterized protein with HEPN domain
MRRDAVKWLEDVLTEGTDALEFPGGQSQENYVLDKRLRAMVERKLFVVGEAMSQLRNHFPEVAQDLPDVREIVGFRTCWPTVTLRSTIAVCRTLRRRRYLSS